MPGEFTSGVGLDILVWLQENGNDLLDLLAKTLHVMGKNRFYLVVLTLVYWSLNKQLGIKLLFALLLGSFFNTLVKQIVQDPRPFQLHPDQVKALVDQNGYSFPSGHVMGVIVVWGTAARYAQWRRSMPDSEAKTTDLARTQRAVPLPAILQRNTPYWLVGGLAVLMAWARMYAGVHYLHDVVGGAVFGLLTLWALPSIFTFAAFYARRAPLRSHIAGIFLLGFVILTFTFDDPDGITIAGTVWGAGFGLAVETRQIRFPVDGTPQQRALRYLVGVVVIGIFYAGLGAAIKDAPVIWRAPVFTVIGFMAVAGWPYLAQRVGLMALPAVAIGNKTPTSR